MTYILSKKKPFNWQSKTVYFFMIQTLIFNGLRDTQSFFDSDQSFLAIHLFGPLMI